jgi:two-component system chemotaxis sensor kinase CheA
LLYATWLEPDFLEVVATIPAEGIRELSLDDLKRAGAQARKSAPGAAPAAAALLAPAPQVVVETPAGEASTPAARPDGPLAAASAVTKASSSGAKEPGETLRIHVGIIDKLMTLAGELVLIRNQFLRAVDRMNPAARPIAHSLDIVTSEIQESVMATRMQPIGNVFGRFARVVRDIGNGLGKQIELEIEGAEVELDKTLIEALTDPLTHLVRNSCDHGLEPPEDRVGRGKPRTGQIRLSAFHEGGQVNILVQDDGRGIDTAKVRKRAGELGFKSAAELDAMSEKETYSLLFLPGFSTAEKVSEISGRGVGLDVVRTSVQQLGGTIEVQSVPGRGTSFQLRLPLTLAIIPCVIVEACGGRFAIPQANVEELVCLYDDDARKIEDAGDRVVYRLRDRLLPIVSLTQTLLGDRANARAERAGMAPLSVTFAVLKAGSGRYGLIVESIAGTEEIVVKPVHSALKRLSWYSGAAVLGDGRVALILDAEGVARNSGVDLTVRDSAQSSASTALQTTGLLIFRFGAHEQFAVSLSQIRRIERLRRSAIEHVGTREFVRLKDRTVGVLRLNELISVSPLEGKEIVYLLVPKKSDSPYGLLSAALVDIIEISLELDTACLREPGVAGSAAIRDKLTLVLDLPTLLAHAESRAALRNDDLLALQTAAPPWDLRPRGEAMAG